MPRLLSCLVLMLLAACATHQARYTGTMTPEAACGPAGRATLTMIDRRAEFAPNDGALLIPAQVAADGTLSGRLDRTGADNKPFPLTLEGTVTEEVATGVYATPRCRFSLLLTRTRIKALGGDAVGRLRRRCAVGVISRTGTGMISGAAGARQICFLCRYIGAVRNIP